MASLFIYIKKILSISTWNETRLEVSLKDSFIFIAGWVEYPQDI
jgi:hypothetical protein